MKVKYAILISTIFYVLGVTFGAISTVNNKLIQPKDLNPKKIDFIELTSHNLSIIGFLFLGILTFGLLSILIIFINGVSLGVTAGSFWGTGYLSKVLIILLPHGLLEIPGFIIAAAGDLLIVYSLICLFKKRKSISKDYIKKGLLLNLLSIFLMIAAGYIETHAPIPTI